MNSVAEVTIRGGEATTTVRSPLRLLRVTFPAQSRGDQSTTPAKQRPSEACRVLNVAVAVVALAFLAPLMLLIAILVKLSSPGPVIYKQPRVGIDRRSGSDAKWADRRKVDYGGRIFTIYKFRTMRAESDQGMQVWARPDDSRVTPLGRVLRKYRLDELPQLFNVIGGDMNIVGPRPEQPKIFASLREEIDAYPQRQRVLPGITGWAQINQSYDTSVEDVRQKVKYDIQYISSQSVLVDVRILFRTIPVILGRRGAW